MLSGTLGGEVVRTRVTETVPSAVVGRMASSTPASTTPKRKGRLISLSPPVLPNIPRFRQGGEQALEQPLPWDPGPCVHLHGVAFGALRYRVRSSQSERGAAGVLLGAVALEQLAQQAAQLRY